MSPGILFLIAFLFQCVSSDDSFNDLYQIYEHHKYQGESFPQKYLTTDGVQPTKKDFTHYAAALSRVVDYFVNLPNDTDPNVALGTYLMSAILKRVLIDYTHKINEEDRDLLKDIVNKAEIIKSHFIYEYYKYGMGDLGFRLSRMFKYDESLTYSLGDYHKNSMTKWINSNIKMHDYVEQMDNITLPKEIYAELVVAMDDYYLVSDSDFCLAGVGMQPMPLKIDEDMKLCRSESKCKQEVFKSPSVAYALSHRYLYLVLLAQVRRCYVISEEVDRMHMDIMCANMYRETVYLARRGYFYRDLFLEHIALCALLGYEEFNRHNWYQKSADWVNEEGCVGENRNFELNRTRLYIDKLTTTAKERRIKRKQRDINVHDECQFHEMALTFVVLACGIRHAAHHMNAL